MSSELIIFLLIVLAVLILLTILGKSWSLIYFLLIFVSIYWFLFFSGLFVYSGGLYTPSVTTGEPPLKGCQIAYKHLMGQYAGNDVGAAFTEVTSIAPNWKCLGIFYDNDVGWILVVLCFCSFHESNYFRKSRQRNGDVQLAVWFLRNRVRSRTLAIGRHQRNCWRKINFLISTFHLLIVQSCVHFLIQLHFLSGWPPVASILIYMNS